MSRVFTLGEIPIIENTQSSADKNAESNPKTKEEIQAYVNSMDDNEKKEYIFFLTHKVAQEKEAVLKALDQFNESVKDLCVISEVSNLTQLAVIYDDLIIPMVRGVYQCTNPMEEYEMKTLKKKIMGKLTLAHFEEYINSKK